MEQVLLLRITKIYLYNIFLLLKYKEIDAIKSWSKCSTCTGLLHYTKNSQQKNEKMYRELILNDMR